MNGKYSQKILDHAKQKTSSKRLIYKIVEVTDDLIDNKIVNKVTRVSKNSQQDNSETFRNQYDKEIPK